MINGKTLLIVEDEEDIASSLEGLLEDHFDKIMLAYTIEKAKSLLYQDRYNLIILDLNLGGRSGAEVLKFLSDNPIGLNLKTPVILMSGIINDDFREKHKNRFAAILGKPFDIAELQKKVIDVVGEKKAADQIRKQDLDEIPIVQTTFPFMVDDIQSNSLKILAGIKKRPKLKNMFAQLNINRTSDLYFLGHIGVLINCCMAISQKLDIHNEKNLEKFLFAAYLHDYALFENSEIAKYKTFEEIDADQWELGEAKFELALNHPEVIYKQLQKMEDLPPDVDLMIRMHHEKPNGSGFPFKSDFKKMSPIVSIFVAAHDLADYILENSNWKMLDFIESRKEVYAVGTFSKILKILDQLVLKN